MNSGYIIIASAGLTVAFVSWVLVGLLIRLAPRIGLLDRPNERSLHTRATPRGGGLGFVLAVALALGVFLGLTGLPSSGDGMGAELRHPVMIYLGAALFIAIVSLRDDFKSLSPGIRFLCQLAVAGAAIWGVGYFGQLSIPGCGAVDLGWAGAGLTVIWIVGLTNVYNFMDGIDGIAGIQGLTAGLAWAAAGIWLGSPAIGLLGLLFAGGSLGFLIYNWSPAKVFMGDVGSAFLGYSFAVLPLLLVRDGPPAGRPFDAGAVPVFALLVVWPFVADGFYTFLRRSARGEAVWKAHRSHLYQRLVQTGWTHARVSTLYGVWCAVSGAAGLFWLSGASGAAVVAWVVPLASLAGIFLLVRHREHNVGKNHG